MSLNQSRPGTGEDRRRDILERAKELFLRQDMTSVSMSDIARECGISRQTLYKYYDSIDAIIFEIQSSIIHHITLSRIDGLPGAIDRLFDDYRQYPEDFLFTALFDLYVHTHPIDPLLTARYHTTIRRSLPDPQALFPDDHPGAAIAGVPPRDYFIVAIHTAWGMLSRMAILRQDYTEEYRITQEESLRILKNMLCAALPGERSDAGMR